MTTTETCRVCGGTMGEESADGYCSMACFDTDWGGRRKINYQCARCGKPCKAGDQFCNSKCRAIMKGTK